MYGNAQLRRCQVKSRDKKRVCNKADAHPLFTTTLAEISPRNPQPRWVCDGHYDNFPSVNPMTGERHRKQYKSYVIKDGELVPLPHAQQYDVIHAPVKKKGAKRAEKAA